MLVIFHYSRMDYLDFPDTVETNIVQVSPPLKLPTENPMKEGDLETGSSCNDFIQVW